MVRWQSLFLACWFLYSTLALWPAIQPSLQKKIKCLLVSKARSDFTCPSSFRWVGSNDLKDSWRWTNLSGFFTSSSFQTAGYFLFSQVKIIHDGSVLALCAVCRPQIPPVIVHPEVTSVCGRKPDGSVSPVAGLIPLSPFVPQSWNNWHHQDGNNPQQTRTHKMAVCGDISVTKIQNRAAR